MKRQAEGGALDTATCLSNSGNTTRRQCERQAKGGALAKAIVQRQAEGGVLATVEAVPHRGGEQQWRRCLTMVHPNGADCPESPEHLEAARGVFL